MNLIGRTFSGPRRSLGSFLVIVLFLAGVISVQAEPHSLSYASVGVRDREATLAAHTGIVTTLSAAINRDIHIVSGYNNQELVQALVKGEIDLAYLGPLPLVAALNISPDLALLAAANEASGLAEYRCFLVSAHDGPAHASEVKGPIAMVNPLSTCGYISVAYILARHGVDIETLDYRFVGNQDHLALQVILGRYAAGGMRDVMAEKYQGLLLRVLDTTPPLPGFVLVANRNSFSGAEIDQLRATLLEAAPTDYLSWGVGNYGFSSADQLDYALIDTLMTPAFRKLFMGDFHDH